MHIVEAIFEENIPELEKQIEVNPRLLSEYYMHNETYLEYAIRNEKYKSAIWMLNEPQLKYLPKNDPEHLSILLSDIQGYDEDERNFELEEKLEEAGANPRFIIDEKAEDFNNVFPEENYGDNGYIAQGSEGEDQDGFYRNGVHFDDEVVIMGGFEQE